MSHHRVTHRHPPRGPGAGPGGHSHGAGHRALQLVQETLHAGPHVLQAAAPVPLGLLFHRGPGFDAQQAVILRDAVVRAESPRQRGACVGLILGGGERKILNPEPSREKAGLGFWQARPRDPAPPVGKPGGLCCTAFSSSSRRSSSERLLPREELIMVGEGSADFCLLGKL